MWTLIVQFNSLRKDLQLGPRRMFENLTLLVVLTARKTELIERKVDNIVEPPSYEAIFPSGGPKLMGL